MIKTLIGAVLVALLMGMIIGSMLTMKCVGKREIKVEPGAPVIVNFDNLYNATIRLCKEFENLSNTWTFVTAEGETIRVDSLTFYKDLPIVTTAFDTSFIIKVEDQPVTIDFRGFLITKGRPLRWGFEPVKRTYNIEIPEMKPFVKLVGSVGVYVKQGLLMSVDGQVDVLFREHYSLSGRGEVEQERNPATNDVESQIKGKIGLRYWF